MIKREFKYGMKPVNCPCCPSNMDGFCDKYLKYCDRLDECSVKRLLLIPYNRIKGVQNKLSCCMGYSEEEKRIRYEELQYVLDEMLKELEVENGSGELD